MAWKAGQASRYGSSLSGRRARQADQVHPHFAPPAHEQEADRAPLQGALAPSGLTKTSRASQLDHFEGRSFPWLAPSRFRRPCCYVYIVAERVRHLPRSNALIVFAGMRRGLFIFLFVDSLRSRHV